MKQQIRRGVFETNSSSTHALSLYKLEDWNKFKRGELVMDDFAYNLVNRSDVDECKICTLEDPNTSNKRYFTFETYNDHANGPGILGAYGELIEDETETHHIISFYSPE